MQPKLLLSLVAGLALVACQHTPQKLAVESLAALGQGANDAYEGYLQSVVQGAVSTNDVPKVTGLYRDFEVSFIVAASAAHNLTNTTFATPQLIDTVTKLEAAIAQIKGK